VVQKRRGNLKKKERTESKRLVQEKKRKLKKGEPKKFEKNKINRLKFH
jgi:hypothetical protein